MMALILKAMANKKAPAKPADEGFLTTAAQAIGSTLGQLAKKAGVTSTPVSKPARRKVAVQKPRVTVKRAPTKKKAVAKKAK
jgi:hypothetical protein